MSINTPIRRRRRKGEPLIIGLTGSIGMGKSTVAAMLRAEGVPVFDADAEVYRLQGPGGALLPAIEAAFPGSTGPRGVDRVRLGAMVFGDAAALRRLESIVHPAIARVRQAFLHAYRDAKIVALDIPLLLERGAAGVDRVLVVSAPAEIQRQRVLARPGMTEQKFEEILARQMPDANKRKAADHVIETGCSIEETLAEVRRVLACLRAERGA